MRRDVAGSAVEVSRAPRAATNIIPPLAQKRLREPSRLHLAKPRGERQVAAQHRRSGARDQKRNPADSSSMDMSVPRR